MTAARVPSFAFQRPTAERTKNTKGIRALSFSASASSNHRKYFQQDDSNSENYENEQDCEPVEYRSVSDYMGGWHAGKFDFDSRIYGVTALNYEKSVVFGDMFTDDDSKNKRRQKMIASLEFEEDSNPPKWSTRPIDYLKQDDNSKNNPLVLTSFNDNESIRIITPTITNEELSWEAFYCTIENDQTGKSIPLDFYSVQPKRCGLLAPRGGKDRYSDVCSFEIVVLDWKPWFDQINSYFVVVRMESKV